MTSECNDCSVTTDCGECNDSVMTVVSAVTNKFNNCSEWNDYSECNDY